MIELYEVAKRYALGADTVAALQPYSGTFADGELVVMTGRSGAGKSTLLSIIGGLMRPDQGRVQVEGRDLWAMSDAARSAFRCQTMGFIFQFASLMPTLTVLENVLLPSAFSPTGGTSGRARAQELLERVGLSGYGSRMPWQLSGGQQRRVAMARALLHRPRILLADEPTADLDEETEREMMALLLEARADGATVLLATHAPELTRQADRHLVLSGGLIRRAS